MEDSQNIDMGKKLMYVTKKQVNEFIERELEYTFKSVQEFINEVNIVLDDLNVYPHDSLNQKKFYGRVKDRLLSPIYWVLTIYNAEDEIISQEVIEYEDEGTATNLAYQITEGAVEYDEGWDWSLKRETFWGKDLVVSK